MAKIMETEQRHGSQPHQPGHRDNWRCQIIRDIRIDGVLNGNMVTKGKVVIGATGRVKGEVECKNSEVSGLVEGKITVSQLLNLKASSKINGTIITGKLSIEPGAVFTGNCAMKEGENGGTAAARPKEGEKIKVCRASRPIPGTAPSPSRWW